uniref:Uncharacterized protein n=1 Tax=Macaca fascicularis TaxID=9541 RepID=A0A7N9CH58_MACFA
MGPCCGLCCDCCRLNVGPCNESETVEAVAAAAPASTAAEAARLNLGATEVHPVQDQSNPEIPKGLAARPKRWTPKLWRWNKIWRFGNKGSVEHLQAFPHGGVEENTGSELDLSTAEYDNRPVEELQEPAHGSVEDMKSELVRRISFSGREMFFCFGFCFFCGF